jgi:hypothetical protein
MLSVIELHLCRYPQATGGGLASASMSCILPAASGPFDGLAHELRRHGVRPAYVPVPWTLRRAWRRYRSATALDRDDRRSNERGEEVVQIWRGSVIEV